MQTVNRFRILATLGLWLVAGNARAEPTSPPAQGYCDFVKGVAASRSAVLASPELFGSFGYLDQTQLSAAPETTANDLRLTVGVQYRIGGLYRGVLTRRRARADCQRRRARIQLERQEELADHRALEARARVLENALDEADEMLARQKRALGRRRMTAQEVTATQLRVDDLRESLADARRDLAALSDFAATPQPPAPALESYYDADAELQRQQAKLRRAQAWDVDVRVGYDRFLEGDDESPYFAVLSFRYNFGNLLQRGAERRAAEGRRRLVKEELGIEERAEATARRLTAVARTERQRLEETAVLLADLESQLEALDDVGGDSGRRYRQMLWFERVKVEAEHEYLRVHLEVLDEMLGESSSP